MLNNYLQILEDSLDKKIIILDQIKEHEDAIDEQLKKEDQTPEDLDAIDKLIDTKTECADELEKLDEGFQSVYDHIREELLPNKDEYKDQIQSIQSKIRIVMDKSTSIQAREERQKKAIENSIFKNRTATANSRRSVRALKGYIQQGQTILGAESNYLDTKK